ncbi:hypothetical protein CRG98_033123, partial [Punica granatum]
MSPVLTSPIKVGHIDDVQELRKCKPTVIPERFVRDMTERPVTACSAQDVPVINISKLGDGEKEISRLADACENWGFFQ